MSAFDDSEIWRSILENLPTGLCVVDMQRRVVLWNSGAEEITGRLRHEVVGHSCVGETLLHCDQPGCEFCSEDCALAKAIKTAQPAETLAFLHHKVGYEVPVRVRAVPVRNSQGAIVGAVETLEAHQPANLGHHADVPGSIDEVTGVASRSAMQSHLREALGAFNDLQVPFGILCFRLEGLDHFRAAFGSEAASSLLRVAARTLEGSLWERDFAGRWAEDQFLVILNSCRDEALPPIRERLRHMLANDSIEWWGERHSLPVVIGQATAQPGDTLDSLLARAQHSLDSASLGRVSAAGPNPSSGSS